MSDERTLSRSARNQRFVYNCFRCYFYGNTFGNGRELIVLTNEVLGNSMIIFISRVLFYYSNKLSRFMGISFRFYAGSHLACCPAEFFLKCACARVENVLPVGRVFRSHKKARSAPFGELVLGSSRVRISQKAKKSSKS